MGTSEQAASCTDDGFLSAYPTNPSAPRMYATRDEEERPPSLLMEAAALLAQDEAAACRVETS